MGRTFGQHHRMIRNVIRAIMLEDSLHLLHGLRAGLRGRWAMGWVMGRALTLVRSTTSTRARSPAMLIRGDDTSSRLLHEA